MCVSNDRVLSDASAPWSRLCIILFILELFNDAEWTGRVVSKVWGAPLLEGAQDFLGKQSNKSELNYNSVYVFDIYKILNTNW